MTEPRTEALIARHLLIHGRVQGVYYRASARDMATQLGLSGWVRNRSSGEVEAIVSGPEQAVERFIDWARQGPPAATVTHIDITPAEIQHGCFEQQPTA